MRSSTRWLIGLLRIMSATLANCVSSGESVDRDRYGSFSFRCAMSYDVAVDRRMSVKPRCMGSSSDSARSLPRSGGASL